ncbi:DUF4123 domain-containing protein [Metapseudomonas otitidis]|uniref:DUF4123 domain-containing protein n=1 Tax=Metapseudomonas otitidis TaxID=319939 RepID=UPI003EE044F3
MNALAQAWLAEQHTASRYLLLIIDTLAEPNPLIALAQADLLQRAFNLYRNTPAESLADIAPWLVQLTPEQEHAPLVSEMIEQPGSNWGWLASSDGDHFDLLKTHWQARALFAEEDGQRALYRLQDNRVIARHLSALGPQQQPLLLGPLSSALAWDGEGWRRFDNPAPGSYPLEAGSPWLSLAEPQAIDQALTLHAMSAWLWEQHTEAIGRIAEEQIVDEWISEHLAQLDAWSWQGEAAQRFFLSAALDPQWRADPSWSPLSHETAEDHLWRCMKRFRGLSR